MLAGSDGCNCSMVGTAATGVTIVARFGDGAWHEPPQPQSKLRLSVGAAITRFAWPSFATADAAGAVGAVTMSASQIIIAPEPAPNSAPRSGS